MIILRGPTGAYCHGDPPGPPTLDLAFRVEAVILGQDEDDGFDDNAEIMVKVDLDHLDHAHKSIITARDNVNWDFMEQYADVLNGEKRWDIFEDLYSHRECTPRTGIEIRTEVTELDETELDDVLGWLTAIGGTGAAIICVIESNPLTWTVTGIVVGVVGVGIGANDIFNDDDDLGNNLNTPFLVPIPPAQGTYYHDITVNGIDGKATVRIKYDHYHAHPDTPCLPDQPPGHCAPPTADERVGFIFDKLDRALWHASRIRPESGNPGSRSPADIACLKNNLSAIILGMAEMAAGVELGEASHLVGADETLALFLKAQALKGEVDDLTALSYFRQAYEAAAETLDNNVPNVSRHNVDFQLVTAPFVVHAKANRRGRILMYPLGVESADAVRVTIEAIELPPKIECAMRPVNVPGLESGVWSLDLTIGDIEPGDYWIGLHAESPDGGVADSSVLLRIEHPAAVGEVQDVTANELDGSMIVRWSPVTEATGYRVYKAIYEGGAFELIGECSIANPCEYIDADVNDGQVYAYSVSFIDQSGRESAYSVDAYSVAGEPPTADVRIESLGNEVIIDWLNVPEYRILGSPHLGPVPAWNELEYEKLGAEGQLRVEVGSSPMFFRLERP